MKFRVALGLMAALAAVSTSTGALAQSWDWHDGYGRGWSDGYYEGQDEGYDRGWVDGWEDRDDHQRRAAYYRDYYDDYDYAPTRYAYAPPAYVCRQSSGTGGLIVGAIAGGLLGHEVARHDRPAGTIIGGGVGALAGRALDRSQSGC